MTISTTADLRKAAIALRRKARSVGGGIVLTLLTIGAVELVSRTFFRIPQPSSLYLLAVAAAAMLGGMRSGLISALIVFGYSVWVTHMPGQFPPTFPPEQTTRLTLFGVVTPAMALLVGGLRKRNDDLLRERLRRELAAEQAARDLQRERRIAATLQSVLLTPLPDENAIPGVAFGSCYEAAYDEAEVGGDFYDVFALDHGTVAVVVGDVSGKGLLAATRTAEVKYTLRAALHDAYAGRGIFAAEPLGVILARVNRMLAPGLSQAMPEATPEAIALPAFVCLTIAVLETRTGAGQVVVAGMEPPMLLRRTPSSRPNHVPEVRGETLEIGGLPIGVIDEAEFQTTAFRMAVGDVLLLSTDGVLESRRRGSRDLFGLDGMSRAAEALLSAPLDTDASGENLRVAASGIVESAKAFAHSSTLKDDACVLLMQRTSVTDSVACDAREASGVVGFVRSS